MQEKLVNDIENIYNDIRPALLHAAYTYKVPNPKEVVDGWMSKAFMIIDRFDKGDSEKKVSVQNEDGGFTLKDYDAEKHTDKAFNRSLKGYLKKAFVNDLIDDYHSKKKAGKHIQHARLISDSNVDQPLHIEDSEFGHLKDVIDLMALDISRLEGKEDNILNLANLNFIKAFHAHCLDMLSSYGNYVAISNLNGLTYSDAFSKDFRYELDAGIRKELAKIIIEEDNPFLIIKLGALIDLDNPGTLQKRISRYLMNYKNGIPKRVKNRLGI